MSRFPPKTKKIVPLHKQPQSTNELPSVSRLFSSRSFLFLHFLLLPPDIPGLPLNRPLLHCNQPGKEVHDAIPQLPHRCARFLRRSGQRAP
jgi:hypothetical protein